MVFSPQWDFLTGEMASLYWISPPGRWMPAIVFLQTCPKTNFQEFIPALAQDTCCLVASKKVASNKKSSVCETCPTIDSYWIWKISFSNASDFKLIEDKSLRLSDDSVRAWLMRPISYTFIYKITVWQFFSVTYETCLTNKAILKFCQLTCLNVHQNFCINISRASAHLQTQGPPKKMPCYS